VQLHFADGETREVRLHTANSSVAVRRLHWLSHSEPVLVLRPASGDYTISFASADDRDAARAALVESAFIQSRNS
jgi:hypothetical protein